jgi:HSP20 family protein
MRRPSTIIEGGGRMFYMKPKQKGEGRELASFRDELDHLFNRFFDLDFPTVRGLFREDAWTPRVDVSESGTAITVKAELPGCNAEDIDVSLEGRRLTIKGEKKDEKEEKEANLHRVERAYGFFSRSIELPAEVEAKDVEASYKKGVLKVVLKKTKSAAAKKIKVATT